MCRCQSSPNRQPIQHVLMLDQDQQFNIRLNQNSARCRVRTSDILFVREALYR